MPTLPLVDVGALKDAAFTGFDNFDDPRFGECILAATEEINREIAPRALIIPSANYVEIHDGDRAMGPNRDEILLNHWPISSFTSVTENGVALVTGTGYDGAGALDVQRYDAAGRLYRTKGRTPVPVGPYGTSRISGWAEGRQNITVTYKAGYTAATLPRDIANACIELAILMYEQADRMGKSDIARNVGGSVTFLDSIPARTAATIRRYSPWGRPRTSIA